MWSLSIHKKPVPFTTARALALLEWMAMNHYKDSLVLKTVCFVAIIGMVLAETFVSLFEILKAKVVAVTSPFSWLLFH